MSLLSALPAPKRTGPKARSRWDDDDEPAVTREMDQRTLITQDMKPAAEAPRSGHWAMVPKGPDAAAHPHPDAEEAAETAKSTMEALNAILTKRTAANNPKAIGETARPTGPQYIKYTPKTVSKQHNSGVDHRIIQMQEMPKDPLEPPKFRHQKHYRVMTEEPTPLMHSPPKKLTREEQEKFSIPPCVSAWKNNKGYTIPLDKRLAADGRGLQEVTLNKKHMDMSLALAGAEDAARRETELQARLQSEMKQREKQRKEEHLRKLAASARAGGPAGPRSLASRLEEEEDGAAGGPSDLPPPPPSGGRDGHGGSSRAGSLPPPPPQFNGRDSGGRGESRQEAAERRERESLRQDRRREREREMRLAEKGKYSRGSALTRDRDRDVSEKIALGQAAVRATEVQYDSRLFNREGGIGSGFRGDDNTAVYDKPLFADRSAMGMYRAKDRLDDEVYGGGRGGEVDTQRFRPDKGFAGTDAGAVERSGPVQFEKKADDEADPFGIDDFLGRK